MFIIWNTTLFSCLMKANAFKVRLYHGRQQALHWDKQYQKVFQLFRFLLHNQQGQGQNVLHLWQTSDFISSLEFLSLRVLAGFCWRQWEASHTLTLQGLESRFFVYFTIAAQQWGKCTNKGIYLNKESLFVHSWKMFRITWLFDSYIYSIFVPLHPSFLPSGFH